MFTSIPNDENDFTIQRRDPSGPVKAFIYLNAILFASMSTVRFLFLDYPLDLYCYGTYLAEYNKISCLLIL